MDVSELHVDAHLSAYLDGELGPAEGSRVEGHVSGCDRCASRLAELRGAAALVAALPSPRPRRSLLPVLRERYVWLRPLRSLAAVASGAFLFLFMVTAVAQSGTGLGGAGATTSESAASAAVPAAAPAPSAAPAAGLAAATPAAQDASKAGGPSAAPSTDAAGGRGSAGASPREFAVTQDRGPVAPAPLTDPRLWLVLAVAAGAVTIVAHRRLRAR